MTMLHNNGITAPIFWYDLHEESSCDVGFGLTMRNNGTGTCATDTYKPVYSSFRGIAVLSVPGCDRWSDGEVHGCCVGRKWIQRRQCRADCEWAAQRSHRWFQPQSAQSG
jgi:hypothetical protein